MTALVVAMMLMLAPGRDHAALAGAIARVVESERPLFADDEGRRKTAALMVAVAYRESTFTTAAVGDHGRSFCAFQIHRTAGGTPALLTDPEGCARQALTILRESLRACPSHPVATYAAGPGACVNARARRISDDRMQLAAWIARKVR